MQAYSETFSWFQAPPALKELLILAAQTWENTSESENYISQVLEKSEENTDVLTAAYRFYYYKNNYPFALQAATKVLETIQQTEKLPNDWEKLKPILMSHKEDYIIRLYLNAYVASGLVLAKIGELEKAKEIGAKVQEIDDKKEFGAAILFDILTNPIEEEE